jgi:exonuclease III
MSIITLNINGLNAIIKRQLVRVKQKIRPNNMSSIRKPYHAYTNPKEAGVIT